MVRIVKGIIYTAEVHFRTVENKKAPFPPCGCVVKARPVLNLRGTWLFEIPNYRHLVNENDLLITGIHEYEGATTS